MVRLLGRLIGLLLLGSSTALAHDWYPASCCSDKDCRPLAEESGETVAETKDGWQLWDGRVIARGLARLSPDEHFHLCESPTRKIICFFAPPSGS